MFFYFSITVDIQYYIRFWCTAFSFNNNIIPLCSVVSVKKVVVSLVNAFQPERPGRTPIAGQVYLLHGDSAHNREPLSL